MSFKMKSKALAAAFLALALGGAGAKLEAQADPFATGFNAVPASSVESRYAHGFRSLVDDYISPVWYSTYDFQSFMFLGGLANPASIGTGVSLGFGKAIGGNYLGVYYGGTLASGSGERTDNSGYKQTPGADKVADTADSRSAWDSSLALLYGMGNMGIRLDLILADTNNTKTTQDGGLASRTTGGNARLAATFGMYNGSNMGITAQAGFKFPQQTVTTNDAVDVSKAPTKKQTVSSGAVLNINGSVDYELNDTSAIEAGLGFATIFATSYAGDDLYDEGFKPYRAGGTWGLNLDAVYRHTLVFGNDTIGHTTLKARPGLGMRFVSTSTKTTIDGATDEQKNPPSLAQIDFNGAFELGAEYKYQKIAVYSQIDFRLFDLQTAGYIGGADKVKSSAFEWSFVGINWNQTALNFGLAFTPIEEGSKKLTFAAGITAPFNLNPRTMVLNTGLINVGTTGSSSLTGTSFNLTVSYAY